MYVYCVSPAMSENPKQLSNCLKRANTSVIMVSFMTSLLIMLLSLNMYQVPENTISSSVIMYDKTLSSNYNFTAPLNKCRINLYIMFSKTKEFHD